MRNVNVMNLNGEEAEGFDEAVKDVCSLVLFGEGHGSDSYVNVYIITDDEIRDLNNRYRNIDEATDVLSFPMNAFDPEKNMKLLGEIMLSEQTVKDQAVSIGHPYEKELAFLCVHGMLHLLGHDHENTTDESAMEVKQKDYIEIVEKEILFQDKVIRKAARKARNLLKNSYAPYSGLSVASIAVTSDNTFFEGVNVENVSFGATSCAERNAIYAAVAKGRKDLKIIAVASTMKGFIYPCGICRQVMTEFFRPWTKIVITAPDESFIIYRPDELMPDGFRRLGDQDGV